MNCLFSLLAIAQIAEPLCDADLRRRFATEEVRMTSDSRRDVEYFYPNGRYEYVGKYIQSGNYTISKSELCVRVAIDSEVLCRGFTETPQGQLYIVSSRYGDETLNLSDPIMANVTKKEIE